MATLCGALLALGTVAGPAGASFGETTRVSVDSSGLQGNSLSTGGTISADGRYVAFDSAASNLVPSDTNSRDDVFVKDLQTGETTRVSVGSSGEQANDLSNAPSISADGRLVAFQSRASNLGPGESTDVFVHDRASGRTTGVGVGNSSSFDAAISADGRFVAFVSESTNLVENDTNSTYDVFVGDRQAGSTTRVSVDSSGGQANDVSGKPVVSADGRFVAFLSYASNLVGDDTNGTADVFVKDLLTGGTTRVSVSSAALQGNSLSQLPAISADGRYVAFYSAASNLVPNDANGRDDVFVHDRQTGTTELVSVDSGGGQANLDSGVPAISADGRFVAFTSAASNLVSGDTNFRRDVFVHDRATGATTRASVDSSGVQGNEVSSAASISADGRAVAFESHAANLVPNDTNTTSDVFVHRLGVTGDPEPTDTADPTIAIASPVDGAHYPLGTSLLADFACADEDGGSGLATCAGSVADGAPLDTSTVGPRSFTVTASDNAGNDASRTHDYRIVYPFGGFQAPVDGEPTLNTAKAGSVIPVKFTLGGDHGLGILAPGSPSSTRYDCGTAADLDEIEETDSVGSGLSYDPDTGAYKYTWKTSKDWAGTCRAFDLELADGTHHRVLFSFR